MTLTKTICALMFVFALFSYCSNADIEHQEKYENHYCEMVADKAWPHYDEDINCE